MMKSGAFLGQTGIYEELFLLDSGCMAILANTALHD